MKKLLLSSLVLGFLFVSCGNKSTKKINSENTINKIDSKKPDGNIKPSEIKSDKSTNNPKGQEAPNHVLNQQDLDSIKAAQMEKKKKWLEQNNKEGKEGGN